MSGTYDSTYVPEEIALGGTDVAVDQSAPPPKDVEDQDLMNKLDAIHDAALTAYQNQTELVEIVDPKFAARNAEVAAQYLTVALNAVNLKAKVKTDREKRRGVEKAGPSTVNNNLIVTDRNALLAAILEKQKA